MGSCGGASLAEPALPNPIKTCEDVRAYIDTDNSMTMDKFKALMNAGGADLGSRGNAALDNQCKMTAFVKQVTMIQRVLEKDDGNIVSVSTDVVMDNGVCKLTNISLMGC
jgi:hypothetical protein